MNHSNPLITLGTSYCDSDEDARRTATLRVMTSEATITEHRQSTQLTYEALADVDAGHVIDHQAVLAWCDSLSTETPLPLPN